MHFFFEKIIFQVYEYGNNIQTTKTATKRYLLFCCITISTIKVCLCSKVWDNFLTDLFLWSDTKYSEIQFLGTFWRNIHV